MPNCPSCAKEGNDEGQFCPFCGSQLDNASSSDRPQSEGDNNAGGLTQGALEPPLTQPPQQQGAKQAQDGVSPKDRNVIMLLCCFFGSLGLHRFYQGKIGTGILMILTIGGLGVWVIADFFISAFGDYNDANGFPVSHKSSKPLAIVLSGLMLVGPIVVLVGLIFRCFQ